MKIFNLFLFVLFIPSILSSQIVITGNVINDEKEPVSVSVTLTIKGNPTIKAFTNTDKLGKYKLVYEGKEDSLVVNVSGMNVGKHSKIISNKSQTLNFDIYNNPILLEEVVVQLPKVKKTGDTIDFRVSAYSDQNDKVLGDVLKKIPGMEVSSSGRIAYNGTPINRFYIEKMDMLQGRYGIATNNINIEHINTIQVLENHQPIKMLENKAYSDNPAINIKLNEESKGILSINATLGGGYKPIMWDAGLVSMFFGKKHQNMNTYKSNNTGDNITSELTSFYEGNSAGTGSFLSVQSPSTPPFAKKRYLLSQTHAISINNLIRLSENYQLNVNAVYYNDKSTKKASSLSEIYLSSDSTLFIEEQSSLISKTQNAEAEIRLNTNSKTYYLNNTLYFKGNWAYDDGLNKTRGDDIDDDIVQILNKPAYFIGNKFKIMKSIKKHIYDLDFNISYDSKPHSLTVYPTIYELYPGKELISYKQNILDNSFMSNITTSYAIQLGYFNLKYNLNASINTTNLNTNLFANTVGGAIAPNDSLRNALSYDNYNLSLNQIYTFQKGRTRMTLLLPLRYNILSVDNEISQDKTKYNKIIFNPDLSLKIDLPHDFGINMNAGYANSFGNINSVYTGYIMHSYRSFLHNDINQMPESRLGTGKLFLTYNNPFIALTGFLGFSYDKSWKNLLYGYTYTGILSTKHTIDQPTSSDSRSVNFRIRKIFDFLHTDLSLSSSYSRNLSEQLVQQKIFDYQSENFQISPQIRIKPFPIINLNYFFTYYCSKRDIKGSNNNFTPITTCNHNLKLNVFPTKFITINFDFQNQYNDALPSENRSSSFFDIGANVKYKKTEFMVEYNNVLNSTTYSTATYTESGAYFYSYDLRPSNVILKVLFKLK